MKKIEILLYNEDLDSYRTIITSDETAKYKINKGYKTLKIKTKKDRLKADKIKKNIEKKQRANKEKLFNRRLNRI
jgi:hypothetical protein